MFHTRLAERLTTTFDNSGLAFEVPCTNSANASAQAEEEGSREELSPFGILPAAFST